MKTCTKCKIEKSKEEFGSRKDAEDGLKSNCRTCCNISVKNSQLKNPKKLIARQARWYTENVEKVKSYSARFYLENKDKKIKQSREWHKNNPDKVKTKIKKWGLKNKDHLKDYNHNYGQQNPDKICARAAKRRASKIQATPPWVSTEEFEQIKELYKEAKRLESLDGIKRHVDHIIPLQGSTVSGLHILINLQILTETENLNKNNKLII
jgi:hypothetical protein